MEGSRRSILSDTVFSGHKCFQLFVFNTYIHADEAIALVCEEVLNITACVIQNCGCDINTLGENTSEDIYNLDRQTNEHK